MWGNKVPEVRIAKEHDKPIIVSNDAFFKCILCYYPYVRSRFVVLLFPNLCDSTISYPLGKYPLNNHLYSIKHKFSTEKHEKHSAYPKADFLKSPAKEFATLE